MKQIRVDHSDWGQLALVGADRDRFLQGMCTSDIEALEEGGWLRTCMLTHKARVIAVFEVIKRADELLLICEPTLVDALAESLDAHIIADDVEIERRKGPLGRVWDTPEAVWTSAPTAEVPADLSSPDEVEIRRIEAGLPRYGVDVSADNFPFETPLVRHIDYQKGCYVGQEPVARVHARGGAQKQLVGLVLEGDEAALPGAAVSTEVREVGVVTSAAISPDFGSIAMAYVRKEAAEAGSQVAVAGTRATVRALPLR